MRHRRLHTLVGVLVLGVFPSPLLGPLSFAAAPIDPDVITRDVLTPDYSVDEQGIHVPGSSSSGVPGAPQLPVHVFLVELPVDGWWEISYESIGDQVLDQRADIPAVPVPLPPAGDPVTEGGPPPELAVTDQPDPAIYSADAFYPASPVQWDRPTRNGDQRLLPVRVYPFQYNPVTHQLAYHPHVRVSVKVANTRNAAPQKGIFQPSHAPFIPMTTGAVRIHTLVRGMHRLTYNDLSTAGVPLGPGGANPNTFAILYEGQPVSIRLTGDGDDEFEPGELVIFYAVPYTKRWQEHNVYWLTYGGAPSPAMATRAVEPSGNEPIITAISQTVHLENNLRYVALAPLRSADEDHFLGERLSVNLSSPTMRVTYPLNLDDYLSRGNVQVRARFHRGNSQFNYNPDNSIAISLNSRLIDIYRWNAETDVEYFVDTAVPATSLANPPDQVHFDANLAYLTSVSPGIQFYASEIDWFELTYSARADAENDHIFIESLAEGANQVQVTGFTTDDVSVFDVRNTEHPVELLTRTNTPAGSTYTVAFWDADLPNPQYDLSSHVALLAPTLVQLDTPSNWGTADHHLDYIAIVPSSVEHGQIAMDLLTAVQPLLAYRSGPAGGGFRVATVDVQDIYDEFAYGRREPMAIREFLAYAYWNWNPGEPARPRYVLLVGDGTYDFIDATGTTMRNFIMPYLGNYDPALGSEVPADNRFVSVDLDAFGHLDPADYTPNLAIARIPAQTVAHMQNAVQKTMAYETTSLSGGWQQRAVFSAGRCDDPAGNLHSSTEEIIGGLPQAYQRTRIYYGNPAQCPQSTAPDMDAFDAQARAAFDNQALYLQWFGHGNIIGWGGGPNFRWDDIDALLPNTVWPMTAHYACDTGYFTYLNGTSQALGEDFLVRWPNRGSVADFSSSAPQYASAMITLGQSMMRSIFQDDIDRVGLATIAAKMYYYAATPSFHQVLDTMHLFGDPALKLRQPGNPSIGSYSFEGTPDWTPPGHIASYRLELTNTTSTPAANTQVTMTLPVELGAPIVLTATNSTPVYHPEEHDITWLGTVAANSTVTLTVASVLSPALSTCELITVTGQFRDPETQNVTNFSAAVHAAVPDVDCDADIDIADIQAVAAHWALLPGNAGYHPRYDLDGDQTISILDVTIAAQAWF